MSGEMTAHTFCVFLFSILFSFIYETAGVTERSMYLGCYQDGGPSNRLFKGHHEDFEGVLTPNKCNEHCLRKGFAYAGTQFSFRCFCSKTKPPDDKKTLESECSSKCSGDESKTCGGEYRLGVFSTGIPDYKRIDIEVLRPIGCFKDSTDRLLSGFRQDFPGALTNQKCVKLCARKGYQYAGTEYGRECHCGNRKPSFKEFAKDEECSTKCEGDSNQLCGSTWRVYIFETPKLDSENPTEDGKYIGCYKDQENSRSLDGHNEDFGNYLTPLKCTGLCYSKGFLYAGTQLSSRCFCGDKPPNPNSKVREGECYKPCTGNPAAICGGETKNSIRETGIPDMPVDDKYLGCFNDHDNQIYKENKLTFDKTNSPRRCMNFCQQLGFRYSGVEYGKQCFCGNEEPKPELMVNAGECNMPCPGDDQESCGAGWRLAVYATKAIHTKTPEVVVPTTQMTPVVVPTTQTTPKLCAPSETIVTGKNNVCKGEVIFEDHFNSLIDNRWSHVVVIPDAPEYHYAVFTSNPENSFTRKNGLVIKPTFFNDSFVQSGALHLKGCMGMAGTRECGYQAATYNILPPVATARIHTRESFSFRYGIVEIRAKLPLGDWLVPELWLEPRKHYYGPGYASGRVRIATIRGNKDFKCNGDDFGSSRMESGVVMGPANNVQRRSLATKLPPNWHDSYHNYTLIWTPENISFKIDNQQLQELVSTGKRLCQVIGFGSEECSTWSAGSKIAPFDQDFYISLGLSVGNARDFPDECMNGGKPKPWRNGEVKATLKFWQDRENWRATWTEEGSSLYIEHIRVTAL